MTKVVHVAVGAIKGGEGAILIAQRARNAHQGGLWEFPGGKVEPGESVTDALRRELLEELAITVEETQPLIQIRHDYADKCVFLDVHCVTRFSGVPCGNEGQPIRWVNSKNLGEYSFPAANKPIVTALMLTHKMLVTGVFSSHEEFLTRLDKALNAGIRLVQFRAPELRSDDYLQLAQQARELCGKYNAQLILNTSLDTFAATTCDALHLNRHEALRCDERPVDNNVLLGVSCHNKQEILHAQKIAADYICLSPVLPTPSHPAAKGMGWESFRALVAEATVPVFALGGMTDLDVVTARSLGAQGIAAISCYW